MTITTMTHSPAARFTDSLAITSTTTDGEHHPLAIASEPAVRACSLSKTYRRGDTIVHALRDVNISIAPGTFTAIMGPSGSGKSTLLHCMAGLDTPSSGTVQLAGTDLSAMSETQLTKLRRREVGFVFQAFNLLPALTVKQNILLPGRLSGHRPRRDWVREVIARTGLRDRLGHRPAELSGGQQQRVAIARALVMRPAVLFADEPTGALDNRSSREILQLLRECVERAVLTVVMVTHDPIAASFADTVLFVDDGRIVDELTTPTVEQIAGRMTRLGD